VNKDVGAIMAARHVGGAARASHSRRDKIVGATDAKGYHASRMS